MDSRQLASAVGQRIRELRRDRGISLSGLAAAAGIGKGSLSELEAGTRNPTLATLYALAGPLGVPLGTMLLDEVGTVVSSDGVSGRLLDVRRYPGGTRETYCLDLDAGARRVSPAHGDGVREHVLVTAGSLVAGPLGAEVSCPAGSTISWTSDVAHSYRAESGAVSSILVVCTPTLE
ncbi:MAG TPA: helix-turn-helix domain-containing protein [Propionicimonas sp.]|nr:helix-turn-helix domain-containing protein [Propionicimonas sp.]